MIYTNHAGTSWPKAPGVADAMQRALLADPREHGALFDGAHAAIASFFGIAARERLLLAPSCTSALGVLLGDLPWEHGDVIVTSGLEHHALVRPVQKLVWERGAEHVIAPRAADGPIDVDAVAAVLRRGRVRVVAVTGASNVTGEVLPVAELARLGHAHGALLLLDAAQTAGVLPVDVTALGADMMVFAGHKGMQGPLGIGGLWAAPHVRFHCPSAACEVGARGEVRAAAGPFPGFCDVGSVNLPGACGLAAAIDWLRACSPDERERPRRLAAHVRAACVERRGVRLLGSVAGEHTATVSVLIDALPLAKAQEHFLQHGVLVRAGQHCAPLALQTLGAPDGCVRISFGPGNRDSDVAAALAAIDAAAAGAHD